MFGAIRSASAARAASRSFSTSSRRASDLAKLTLIGRLGRDPELKYTKNNAEFVTYVVATSNYPPPPPDANGERPPAKTSWHRILSFTENSNKYLLTLRKGSRVYVEANYELREPEPDADPTTPMGQRQIFLRHETLRLLSPPPRSSESADE
ncbi:ssDNA-binding protein, mitochondrial [Stygiomarasmius scandens]|uniref:SsDNA-binding protein, mitochondrial n=1 Tax=Marasmiellus scandens TaxID=2682957 RepID=A0ABR1K7A5_9AGAR